MNLNHAVCIFALKILLSIIKLSFILYHKNMYLEKKKKKSLDLIIDVARSGK